jgi:hypothetical protein
LIIAQSIIVPKCLHLAEGIYRVEEFVRILKIPRVIPDMSETKRNTWFSRLGV